MAIKDKIHKLISFKSTYANEGDVVNGDKYVINNYSLLPDEFYHTLTKKNYTEFYKKYIQSFKELENYAVDVLFPYSGSKQYNFSDAKLIFGKQIIDWILGKEKFPYDEIQKFYLSIKNDYELPDDSILVKRWEANNYYFKGDIDSANRSYSELFDEIIDMKDIPTWYIDDICIDGRNFLIESNGKYDIFRNKYYVRLSSIKHKLSYPDIDRAKVEIYEKVQKIIFNNKNKGKYTSFFGIGLENCFSQIQNLIYMTIFYGSITHLRIIRKLIADVMYMYAETFDDQDFYKLTLKMLFLSSGDQFKKFNNLYEKIVLKYRFVTSKEFIDELVSANDSLLPFEYDDHMVFMFEKYGYYFDDEYYSKLEDKCIDILNSNSVDSHKKLECLRAFKQNMYRTSKIEKLMDFMITCFLNENSLYYTSFGPIINSIDISKLNAIENKKLDKIIQFSIKNKNNINYDISHCIVDFKKNNPKINKYDKLINTDSEKTHLIYMIENDNSSLEVVKKIVEILKQRHEKNEKHPGVSTDYSDEYRIGTNIFELENFSSDMKLYFENEFIPFAREFLLSENETIGDKITIIKLLIHLLKKDYSDKTKNDIIDLIDKCENVKHKNEYRLTSFKERSIDDLKINVMMSKSIAGALPLEKFFTYVLEMLITDDVRLEEVLDCIYNAKTYLELNDTIVNYLFIIGKKGFISDDYEIKNLAIYLLGFLINTNKKDEIIDLLLKDCQDISLREFNGYYNLLNNIDESLKNDLSEIIILLKNHKNFFIRNISINRL